jgi:hypothetical protein
LGGIRGFFILTRDLEKKRKFFSLVLGKIREVSLPFVVDGSDMALWRISTGQRHHLLYYSGLSNLFFKAPLNKPIFLLFSIHDEEVMKKNTQEKLRI